MIRTASRLFAFPFLTLATVVGLSACSSIHHRSETKSTEAPSIAKTADVSDAETGTVTSKDADLPKGVVTEGTVTETKVNGIPGNASMDADNGLTWDYTGDKGPEHWGQLKAEYGLCANGKTQSPVDLKYKKPHSGRPLVFDYHPSHLKVFNSGNTIQLNFDAGSFLTIGKRKYELKRAVFHTSSEHTIAGNHLPMEMELIHKSVDGHIAIVSVIMIEGAAHPLIERAWQNIPPNFGAEKITDIVIDPIELLPKTHTYYNYTGSLTAPPCTEGVDWNVLNTPVTISKEQILAFRKLYPHNNRPIQKLGDRKTVNYK